LHSLQRMRFHHKINILLKIIFNNFDLHFFFILCTSLIIFTTFLSCLFLFLYLLFNEFQYRLFPFFFLIEWNIQNIFRIRWFFGKILIWYTMRTNHFNVELLSQDDIVFKTRLNFKIFNSFFVEISQHEHTIGHFFLKQRDLFFYTIPYASIPLGIIFLFLLKMSHFNNI
jgi:hypothetical protein